MGNKVENRNELEPEETGEKEKGSAANGSDADPNAEIETLKKERNEFQDLLQRKQAEFENFRRRVRKEKEALRVSVQAQTLRELLTVLDAAEKGLSTLEQEEDPRFESYRKGYQLLVKQMNSTFDRLGVEEVPGTGHTFDPNLHEAVLREETNDHQDGEILQEFRKGYVYRDVLLRPSQVKVAVHTEPPGYGSEGKTKSDHVVDERA